MKKYIFSALGFFLTVFLAADSAVLAQNNGETPLSQGEDMPVVTETPAYFGEVSGFLAKPEAGGTYPGVVIIHEFWGLNDNIKNMARELAKEGYVVLAVDLYEGEVTSDPARARELSSGINQERSNENLRSAVRYLKEREDVSRVASLGWCFGGGQSLQLSISGESLDATVIYYGSLTTDRSALSKIKWPVLGIFGEEDRVVSVRSVKDFQAAISGLGISNEIYIYPGVGHAFANPSNANYAMDETLDAWAKTLNFLEENLKK